MRTLARYTRITAGLVVEPRPLAADIIAKRLSDYFTSGSGITVIFESALVPNLFASTITLNNVYVSRRPADARVPSLFNDASSPIEDKPQVVAAGGFKYGPEDHREHPSASPDDGTVEDDGNYTQFDLNIDRIEVELSFVRWLNGEGLVKSAVVSGVRGVLGASDLAAWLSDLIRLT